MRNQEAASNNHEAASYEDLAEAIEGGFIAPQNEQEVKKWRDRESRNGLGDTSKKLSKIAADFPAYAAQWRSDIAAALNRSKGQRAFDEFTDAVPLFGLGYLLKKSPAGVRHTATRSIHLPAGSVPFTDNWVENIKSATLGWGDLEAAVAAENARLKNAKVPMMITADVIVYKPSQISNKGYSFNVVFEASYHDWNQDEERDDS